MKPLGIAAVLAIGAGSLCGLIYLSFRSDADAQRAEQIQENGKSADVQPSSLPITRDSLASHPANGFMHDSLKNSNENTIPDDAQQRLRRPDERAHVEADTGDAQATAKSIDPGPHAGVPFPTSASVMRYCDRISALGSASCADHLEALAQLNREERDPNWAPLLEKELASVVNSDRDFRIRALECRTTVCAVEIESSKPAIHLQSSRLDDRLSRVDRIIGYEQNGANDLIKVTSITFKRVGLTDSKT